MKPRDLNHERNHRRQAGPMKDRRRELTEEELIEEQHGPGCLTCGAEVGHEADCYELQFGDEWARFSAALGFMSPAEIDAAEKWWVEYEAECSTARKATFDTREVW